MIIVIKKEENYDHEKRMLVNSKIKKLLKKCHLNFLLGRLTIGTGPCDGTFELWLLIGEAAKG